jgi:cupin fold WbuC family metalloprotein
MLLLDITAPDTYTPRDSHVTFGGEEVRFLQDALHRSPHDSIRISVVRPVDPRLVETFLIFGAGCGIRARAHPTDDSSLFAIDGAADLLLLDSHGTLLRTVPIGDRSSGLPYFCRIPHGHFYDVRPHTDSFLCLQASSGPPNDQSTICPDWPSLPGSRDDSLSASRSRRAFPTNNSSHLTPLADADPRVMIATESVVTLGPAENRFLVSQRARRDVDRLRICVHKTTEDRLHEMLMTFTPASYIRPSLHVDKEESLLAIQGLATVFFFNYEGDVTSCVRLGGPESGRDMYCRIPANAYHSVVVETCDIVLKETARGPFERSDTRFPTWAPDGTDEQEVRLYLTALRSRLL